MKHILEIILACLTRSYQVDAVGGSHGDRVGGAVSVRSLSPLNYGQTAKDRVQRTRAAEE